MKEKTNQNSEIEKSFEWMNVHVHWENRYTNKNDRFECLAYIRSTVLSWLQIILSSNDSIQTWNENDVKIYCVLKSIEV